MTSAPVRCRAAEAALAGQAVSDASLTAAAQAVREAISDPLGDVYASGEYRTHLATVIAQRALERAVQRAG